MKLITHLASYFIWYILGLVVILLGLYFRFNGETLKISLKNMYNEAFYQGQDVELKNLGAAPELTGLSAWLNSEPLTLNGLKGKVVLIDFWTYSCINCIRTLPHVTQWYEKYKDEGFVVIGVHTPEFVFEKEIGNVERALKQYKINYPVALDNDYATWRAYNNRYWPAHYLIDQSGQIVYTHFGEGNYDITENAIRALLDKEALSDLSESESSRAQTPEIYFGSSRLEYLSTAKENLPANHFALDGDWQLFPEYAELSSAGSVRLNFKAAKVHMVVSAAQTIEAEVFVDGEFIKRLPIKASDLYTLFESETAERRELEIRFPQGSVRVFTFTFG